MRRHRLLHTTVLAGALVLGLGAAPPAGALTVADADGDAVTADYDPDDTTATPGTIKTAEIDATYQVQPSAATGEPATIRATLRLGVIFNTIQLGVVFVQHTVGETVKHTRIGLVVGKGVILAGPGAVFVRPAFQMCLNPPDEPPMVDFCQDRYTVGDAATPGADLRVGPAPVADPAVSLYDWGDLTSGKVDVILDEAT